MVSTPFLHIKHEHKSISFCLLHSSLITIKPSNSINPIYTSTIHGFSPPPPLYNLHSQERNPNYPPDHFIQNPQDLLHGFFFPNSAPHQDNNNGDVGHVVDKHSHHHQKRKDLNLNVGKKDRHSKICTAAGPRDRRVRLSMDIARKFFDLQDLLGFDKASKTLDWLFTSSKDSIRELVNMKMKMAKCINTNITNTNPNPIGCLYEMVYNTNTNDNSIIDGKISRDAFHSSSRESRANARARARYRTREKLLARRNQIMANQDLNQDQDQDNSLLRLMNGYNLPRTTSNNTTSPNQSSSSRSWPQIEPIPNIWDISTNLIPPELQYHGKPWDMYNNQAIPVDQGSAMRNQLNQ